MNEKPDARLLSDFAVRRDEAAFHELVTRHADLVYSAAMRQLESPALAADVAQTVFTDLAQKAASLAGKITMDSSLAGWLHRATRYAALNHLRDDRRRRDHERQAMEQLLIDSEPSADWRQIAPMLDEALDSLDDDDREALLLRYFKNQDFRAVGVALGVSDDTAQKRVSRAVEKLREYFTKRKVTIGAGSLGILISANAVQSAPVGLAATISAAALTGAAVSTSTLIAATTKTIAMTTLQKTLITATLAVFAGAGIYEAKQAHDARAEAQRFQEQQAVLAGQIQQLQNSFIDATNRLAGLLAENSRLKSDNQEAELLKLRGDIGVLRNQLQQQKDLAANSTNETANAGHRRQMSQFIAKDQMRNAGFDTPEAGFQTFMAAMASTNYDAVLASMSPHTDQPQGTPEDRQKFQEMVAQNMESFQGMEIIAKKYRSDDRVDLEVVSFAGTNAPTIGLMQMKKVNDQWKYFQGATLPSSWERDKDVQAINP